jgi:hypothetical protein
MRIIELFRDHKLIIPQFLFGLVFMVCSGNVNAQCPISLGCNDSIQISLGFDCDAEITPALILEDERDNCEYMVNLLTENDRVVASTELVMGSLRYPRVDGSFIGQRWKAEVFFINDNNTRITCWGYFTVEDKLPPEIECINDFTVNCNDDLSDLFTSSSSVTYSSQGVDLDNDPNTITVEMCAAGNAVRPNLWEIIESVDLSIFGATTGSGSTLINGVPVDFEVENNESLVGDIIGTQADTSACLVFTFDTPVVPPGNFTTTINSASFFEYQAIDNCDPNLEVLVTFDQIQNLDCVNDITAERTIRYFTRDDAGLSTDFCEFRIAFEKKSLSDIVFPENFTVDCDDAPLTRDGELDLVPSNTGQPMLDGNVITIDDNLCRIDVTFSDDTFNLCGINTIRILRRWTALDWCLGQFSQSFQTIIVEDNTAPIVSCPIDDMEFLSGSDCTATVTFRPLDPTDRTGVDFIDECSDVTVVVEFLRGDERDPNDINQPFNPATSLGNNVWRADGLQSGRNWIRYEFTDACGLVSECRFEILVVDDNAPVPVCDQFTAISLDDSGWGRLFPLSIDDGSFDQCGGPVDLEIRRSNSTCSGEGSDTRFGEFVSFCCEEAGDTIMVMLRVTDEGGRSNTCEVSVVVQDKSDFSITCPSLLNIDLDCSEINNIGTDRFGMAMISDDCGAGEISFSDNENFDDVCGQGTVVRTFTLTLNNNAQQLPQCTQTFTFASDVVLTQNSFVFPSDRDDATCSNFTTDLGDAPTFNGVPVTEAAFCGDLTYSFSDLVFEQSEGYCVKVIRTWTVIDLCTHDPSVNPDEGIFTDTQIIRVSDNSGPELSGCPEDITIEIDNSTCLGTVSFDGPTAVDLCLDEDIDADDITYVITGPNNFSRSGDSNIPSTAVGIGTFNVVWTAEGICGNSSSCTHQFVVTDTKAPTPYCLSGATTVLVESNTGGDPSVQIWADDFDLGSADNCGDVIISFSSNVNDNNLVLDCGNIGMNTIEVWVTDESGNQDFCVTTLIVQANDDICDGVDTNTGSRPVISGSVGTEFSGHVEGVEVVLQNMVRNTVEFAETNDQGEFAFPENEMATDYRVFVNSSDDYLNGVSTIDLLNIQRHILGSQRLDSPYKVVAADVDNSQTITAIDLIELRKLILGIYDELPNNDSWRYVYENQNFIDPNSPWPLQENIDIYDMSGDLVDNNFIAVKIGDVNGSVTLELDSPEVDTRNANVAELNSDILEISEGVYLVPFYLNDVRNIQGLQLNLTSSIDIKILEIESGKLKLNSTNYNLLDNGIKLLWHDSQMLTVGEDEALFYLTVSSPKGFINEDILQIASQGMSSEIYIENDEVLNLKIKSSTESKENRLYQNTPNPFTSGTVINFDIYKAMNVQLVIYDVHGRVVKTIDASYDKGSNFIEILPQDLNGTGIYYYHLSADSFTDSRKMIFIQ